MKESDRDIVGKHDIAYAMIAYFCSVVKGLASKIEAVLSPLVTGKYNLNPQKAFQFYGFQDSGEAMVNIKTSKSFGSNEISRSKAYNSCYQELATFHF